MPAACRRQLPGANDKVRDNTRDAWLKSLPFVVTARRAKSQEAHRAKQLLVLERRDQLRQEWLQAHDRNQQRLQRLRAARVEASQRQHAITRQRFWLAMLWASAAQETLGREVVKAREKRAELARAHEQIVRIQASVRMFLARRYFKRLQAAATLIQRGVRLFLRMLFVRRRREAALRILKFLVHAHRASKATLAFHRLVRCIQTLKAFIRRYCLVRDARILVLKMQWQQWEAEHIRRLTTEARARQQAARPRDGDAARPAARDTTVEDVTIPDAIKTAICRQHCSNKSAEFVQRWRRRRVLHEELLQHHGVDIVRERCFLLGRTPETEPEFLDVLARVHDELGPSPLFRVVETPATLAKLHRQGCRLHEKRENAAPMNVKIACVVAPGE